MGKETILWSRRSLLKATGFILVDSALNKTIPPTFRSMMGATSGQERILPGNDNNIQSSIAIVPNTRQEQQDNLNCKSGGTKWDLPSAFGVIAALGAEFTLLPTVCDWDRGPEPRSETAVRYGSVIAGSAVAFAAGYETGKMIENMAGRRITWCANP